MERICYGNNFVLFAHSSHTVNSTTLILCSEASTEMLINWRIRTVVFFFFKTILRKPDRKVVNLELLLNIV